MTRSKRWPGNRPILVQTVLLFACCLAAVLIRRTVATDVVGDLAAVLLELAGLLGFMGASIFAGRLAMRPRGLVQRVVLRAVPVALVLAGATFVTTSYADVSVALHALASGGDMVPTTIVLGPEGKDVRLSGSLAEGAARQLETLLAAHPHVARIHLTSDGGLVEEGDGLRRVIATHRLTTFVPDYCISACTLAFLGGPARLIMTGARLGFHSPFEEGLFGQTFVGDRSAERASYMSAGVPSTFVDRAFAVAPSDIWMPEADLLVSAHIVTGIVDRYRFPDSNLDGAADLAGARAMLLRNFPIAKALGPTSVDAVAGAYLTAYRSGVSEGQAVDGLRSAVAAAAAKVVAGGDDDTMVAVGRFLEAAMQVADSDSDCIAIGRAADLIQAEEALDDGDGKADELVARLLKQALASHRPARTKASAAVRPVPIADKPSEGACTAIRGLYEHALRLPSHAAAEQIRALTLQSSQAPTIPILAH